MRDWESRIGTLPKNWCVSEAGGRAKWPGMSRGELQLFVGFGYVTCNRYDVGRVPTRSVLSFKWEGRGPLTGWYGSFPPASEREARMDDPMTRLA